MALLSSCSPASEQGGGLPQNYLEDSNATGTAAVRDMQMTSQVSIAKTAAWVDTQSALSVQQTQQQLSIEAGRATGTAEVAGTRQAATETEAPRQTSTAAAIGTPTAAAQQTAIAGTATAEAPYKEQGLYFNGGLLVVCLFALIFFSVMFGLGIRWVMGSVSDRINQVAVAEADARRITASAKAEKDRAEAAKIYQETMRQNMVKVGPYLIYFTPAGPQVFKTIEELPAPDDDVPGLDPVANLASIRRPKDDPLERLSSGQAAMARFVQVCFDINGAGSNVIPTADKLEAKGISRDDRQLMVNILKGLKLVKAKPSEGTWLVGEYRDLQQLLQACLSGRLPVPDIVTE